MTENVLITVKFKLIKMSRNICATLTEILFELIVVIQHRR